jgi:hypothetical protein
MTSVRRRAALRRRAITAGSLLAGPVLCLALSGTAAAAPSPADRPDHSKATSDRAARDEALRAIPWRQIAPQQRRPVELVVKHPSIYRRLPTRIIDCDPDLFTFLARHPEVVIDVWRVMGLSQVALDRIGPVVPDIASRQAQPGLPCYRATDGAGTTGTVRFVYADWGDNARNLAVVYAQGAYEGKPLVTPLKAQSVLLLRSGAVQETNGRHYVTVRIDSFLRIEQVGIELVAKTIQPWISKTADHNFIETLTFVSNFSRAAEQNPYGIQRLATRLPTIDEPTRNELVALSFRTAQRYAQCQPGANAPLLASRPQARQAR